MHTTHAPQALSKRIGWFAVSTSKVLCGMHKVDNIQQLVERDGREAVGERTAAHRCVAVAGTRPAAAGLGRAGLQRPSAPAVGAPQSLHFACMTCGRH